MPESFSEADAVALLEALRGSKCGPSGSSGMAKARLHTCGGPGRRPALATARQGRRITILELQSSPALQSGATCGGFYANSLVRGAWRLSGNNNGSSLH